MTEASNPANDVESITVEWKGVTYTLPSGDEMPVDVLEAIEDGKATSFVRAIIGPRDWPRVKKGMTVTDLNELGERIAKAYGFESAGE